MDAQWSLFSLKSRTFGLGQINSGTFEVFLAKLPAHILVQWVPCPCFPLFNHYFYKKLSLYIHIPNIYLGFEFGPIRDSVFSLSCVRSLWRKVMPLIELTDLTQGPLNIWTEHSNCQIHSWGWLKNPFSFTDTQYFLDFNYEIIFLCK